MPSKVWDGITYPIPNVNANTVEVLEWISNSIAYVIMVVIAYPGGVLTWAGPSCPPSSTPGPAGPLGKLQPPGWAGCGPGWYGNTSWWRAAREVARGPRAHRPWTGCAKWCHVNVHPLQGCWRWPLVGWPIGPRLLPCTRRGVWAALRKVGPGWVPSAALQPGNWGTPGRSCPGWDRLRCRSDGARWRPVTALSTHRVVPPLLDIGSIITACPAGLSVVGGTWAIWCISCFVPGRKTRWHGRVALWASASLPGEGGSRKHGRLPQARLAGTPWPRPPRAGNSTRHPRRVSGRRQTRDHPSNSSWPAKKRTLCALCALCGWWHRWWWGTCRRAVVLAICPCSPHWPRKSVDAVVRGPDTRAPLVPGRPVLASWSVHPSRVTLHTPGVVGTAEPAPRPPRRLGRDAAHDPGCRSCLTAQRAARAGGTGTECRGTSPGRTSRVYTRVHWGRERTGLEVIGAECAAARGSSCVWTEGRPSGGGRSYPGGPRSGYMAGLKQKINRLEYMGWWYLGNVTVVLAFLVLELEYFGGSFQYHGCWYPDTFHGKVISKHGTTILYVSGGIDFESAYTVYFMANYRIC